MRRTFGGAVTVLTVILASLTASGASAGEELGRGHILTGGPWISFRSVTVLTNNDSADGFFLPLSSAHSGRSLSATVARNGSGAPYALSVNFHGSTKGTLGRNWLGGCRGIAVDQQLNFDPSADVTACAIPAGAVTVEVTAFWGADLDVLVTLN